jgi:hypothetical protein
MTPLSRILADRDALDLAAWHMRGAHGLRIEIDRRMAVPLYTASLVAEHRVRLAYVLTYLLEWWRR